MLTDLIALDESSKIWIYQADRELSEDERDEMKSYIASFVSQWTAHANDLKAYGSILHNRFLVLVVDETVAGASGCSIDSSVRFVKALGEKYNIDFFKRMDFAFLDQDEKVQVYPSTDFKEAFENGTINKDTLVFNNLVKTKKEFKDHWVVPLHQSWHARFVK